MRRAIQLAQKLPEPGAGDQPVGAVVYDRDGNEIAAAHHDREHRADPTAYAEILACSWYCTCSTGKSLRRDDDEPLPRTR
ncbi:hypothetical protein GCM10009609_39610 [Pseudonocardia aurantiaca]|uniref:CMP/dCMP-type deaminase domain-containing protein n=1 Tax=Pseudonocardia aurantiaca TaxID=75290 RepID=A0ABW4FIF7_9PSEU